MGWTLGQTLGQIFKRDMNIKELGTSWIRYIQIIFRNSLSRSFRPPSSLHHMRLNFKNRIEIILDMAAIIR